MQRHLCKSKKNAWKTVSTFPPCSFSLFAAEHSRLAGLGTSGKISHLHFAPHCRRSGITHAWPITDALFCGWQELDSGPQFLTESTFTHWTLFPPFLKILEMKKKGIFHENHHLKDLVSQNDFNVVSAPPQYPIFILSWEWVLQKGTWLTVLLLHGWYGILWWVQDLQRLKMHWALVECAHFPVMTLHPSSRFCFMHQGAVWRAC